jgi:acyl-CoA oxidase
MLVSNFHAAIQSSTLRAADTAVLTTLFRLFALYTIDAEAREFQTSAAVGSATLDALPDRILALMQQVRPHAVRLVDAFALPDFLLDR